MPPRPGHGSSEEWLQRAQASLALARQQGEGVLLEDLCYQVQQAAEKL
jgi:HEPN domain-containing protein